MSTLAPVIKLFMFFISEAFNLLQAYTLRNSRMVASATRLVLSCFITVLVLERRKLVLEPLGILTAAFFAPKYVLFQLVNV